MASIETTNIDETISGEASPASARRFPWWIAGSAIAVLLMVVGVGGYLFMGGDHTVPAVAGKTPSEAKSMLDAAGLTVGKHRTQATSAAPPGMVLRTEPATDARVAKGASIDLVVAALEQTAVPNVTGKALNEATSALETAGLVAGERRTERSGAVSPGTILRTEPAVNTPVGKGVRVDLVVALVEQVAVPDILGKPLAEGQALLAQAGLVSGATAHEPTSQLAAGAILHSDPAALAIVDKGTSVEIVIAVPEFVAVPNVARREVNDAVTRLRRVGLVVDGVRWERTWSHTSGTVVRTSPPSEVRVEKGTRVLVIAARPY